ncbi:Molybdopterin-guanine dinucleotide biosynthesis protein A (MobA) (PDB:1E5K) (PUBMED:32239579) [Commensalibacter communis]|uniref:molybdenum cofactor guanylyltransferase MobA n=1 Tax=Commensalibacter communis TaxID=2972786 RepID=UPI0022FFB3EB|nr:molybdenum cofactor guanylyltransferase MobA [Commensalibacter communis]CAI3939273.1 Molybdopterin-guanine dinucleotide biosynthesis protein A (MobA) (PDB:1E5K) (PUBMED:32239579) [Commensalibacter communis]CAI3940551.1 Molybdopterin-guanine dinucleotide biosynthesis protein A (MobA) (PDB:1E5K) (PUBMED:32239579) [Commensalibacter communis]
MIKQKPIITGVILAGGEGRRMGRKNKGLIPLNDRPLIQHVIKRLHPQLDHILISANEDIATYQELGFPVISDHADFKNKGPLAGILSTTAFIPRSTDAVLIVPCDTPFLPIHLVSLLVNNLYTQTEYEIAYAATTSQIHPSIFLYKPTINNQLAAHLNQQQYSLKSWIFKHNAVKTIFEDEHAFTNMNDMETLRQNQ